MTIHMQGSWTVSVKSKSAAYSQRFIITGADVGNGIYSGNNSTPSVFASGANWSIQIQNKPPKKSWLDSDDQITFPVLNSGLVRFDIQSNDAGGDEDFNDLILTCATPQSTSDYILYGHASCYSGYCLFNPCIRFYVVIESFEAYLEAIRNPLLREALNEIYPERVKEYERPPLPIPDPDPDPFIPMMLPLREQTAVPPKLGQEMRMASDAANADESPGLIAGRVITLANQPTRAVEYDRVALADLVSKLRLRCDVEALPGFVLRFNEYDRTDAELTGGAYNGDGNRELLGHAVTDRNGNYIFRFSREISDTLNEYFEDTAGGEDPYVQALPDVIAELLDSTAPDGVAHETPPHWNIPGPLKRIDICIPCHKVRRPVTECTGTNRFESVGRIRIGISDNTFDLDGRITATDSSPNVPQARCAAWGGTLDLFGCLGDHKTVKYYTIRYRRYVSGTGWTDWDFYQEPFKLLKTSVMDTVQIGPFDHNLEIVNGSPKETAKAYLNVQGDYDWATSEWALRASVRTTKSPFGGHVGPVEFRIQGYDDHGLQVADPRNERIRLYIDNQRPDFVLDTVTIGGQKEGGRCAVFTLKGEPVPAVLKVRFKVIQEQGLLEGYDLTVRKGNYPSFDVVKTGGPFGAISAELSNSYVHTSGKYCSELVGTRPPDEATAVGDFATAYIIPDKGNNWLNKNESVCAYAVRLGCSKRVTNGYNDPVVNYGPIQKLLAIKKK